MCGGQIVVGEFLASRAEQRSKGRSFFGEASLQGASADTDPFGDVGNGGPSTRETLLQS